MEPILFLIFATWLLVHLFRTSDRINRLENSVKFFREHLFQMENQSVKPVFDETETSEVSQDRPLPPVLSEQEIKEALSPPPLPMPESKPGEKLASETLHRHPKEAKQKTEATSLRKPSPLAHSAFEWRLLLGKVKLWPPTGQNAEATIAAWWLVRIGLIIGIIGAVFFGVRIAEDTSPRLRLAALAGIAAGVILLGAWLEKRLADFGRLISAGGLGLAYFTAFAAYGVQATKTIDNPVIGFFVQAIAVGAVIAWSLWKRDEAIAAMAMLLGFVVCWFSHHHDLDHFVITGLLFLATGASCLFVLRRWLWPFCVATAGSWFGFLILAVGEWPNPGQAPSFPVLLISLVFLITVLEAANFLVQQNAPDSEPTNAPRWRRWLAIANTTFAVTTGWLAVRLAFPERIETTQLDAFYLTFAALFGIFAGLRFWKHHPIAITETFFLKAAGLLALFFVAWFDGPTRWLSLTVQVVIVLVAWRRSQLKLIEVGFGALLIAALGVIFHDAFAYDLQEAWQFFTIRHLVGVLSMTILSGALALYARWSPTFDKPQRDLDPRGVLRFFGALAVGGGLLALVLPELAIPIQVGPILLLSIASLIVAAPAAVLRRLPPVVAGLTILVPAFFIFFQMPDSTARAASGLWTGVWFSALGFGLAEIVLRLRRSDWALGNIVRFIFHGLGVISLALTLARAFDAHASSLPLLLPVLGLFGFALAGAWALFRQSANSPAEHLSKNPGSSCLLQLMLAFIIGLMTVYTGNEVLEGSPYRHSFLALAAALLFASALFTRNAVPALAGGVPFLSAVAMHFAQFDGNSIFAQHLLAAILIIAVCLATAIALRQSVVLRRFPSVVWFDAALHAIGLLLIHWIACSHLGFSEMFLVAALIALAVVIANRRFPFQALAAVSALILVFAIVGTSVGELAHRDAGAQWLWWLSALAIGGWLWFSHCWFHLGENEAITPPVRRGLFIAHEGVAAIALSVAGYHALNEPWHLVSLAGFGVCLAALGRRGSFPASKWWSLAPLSVAIFGAILVILFAISDPPLHSLIAISLIAALVAGHGIILIWREPKTSRSLAWIPALIVLILVLPAYADDHLGVGSLATVCWGITAVVLFVAGLVAGLRPYRLAGLIGLGIAMIRMFIVDIDDSLYRIYAFFAIAAVLLGVGYLYHRFRHLIERPDPTTSE
ncbi:MAG: DUF2339 domain-containing protein [Akkermansiaceae bacterium]|nr:DUF2339 domain-containing protein [Akkermansiaceae bacterium]